MAEGLRITGGDWRGRKLESPPKDTHRPASDMIRQAVFNMLGQQLDDASFVDVFAGTGVVGLEALSRGAIRTVFVERDGSQIRLLRRNIEKLRVEPRRALVRAGDAHIWAKHFIVDDEPMIVFLGPPYPDFEIDDRLLELVKNVQARLRPIDTLVFQYPKEVDASRLPDPMGWFRLRVYGKTGIGLWRKEPTDPRTADAGSDADATLSQTGDIALSPQSARVTNVEHDDDASPT